MPTAVSLTPGAIAFAAFVILYTFLSMLAAMLTYLLFRVQGQQILFISFLSLAIAVLELTTMVQELLQMSLWPTLLMALFDREQRAWLDGKASLALATYPHLAFKITEGIKTYFFNVASLIFLIWNIALAISVWKQKKGPVQFCTIAKFGSFVAPAIQATLVHLPVVQKNEIAHIVLTNCLILPSLLMGAILLTFTLIRTSSLPRMPSVDSGMSSQRRAPVLLRFTIGFSFLAGLQAIYLARQFLYAQSIALLRNREGLRPLEPGRTHSQQLQDWGIYLPNASMGFMIYFVFATTREVNNGWKIIRGWAKCEDVDARELGLDPEKSCSPLSSPGKSSFATTSSAPPTVSRSPWFCMMQDPEKPYSPPRMQSLHELPSTQSVRKSTPLLIAEDASTSASKHAQKPSFSSPKLTSLQELPAANESLISISEPRVVSWSIVSALGQFDPELPRPSSAARMDSGRFGFIPGSR